MRIVVIGAAGRVGAHVMREAVDRGHSVLGLVRRTSQLDDLRIGSGESAARGLVADATDTAQLARLAVEHDVLVLATRSRRASIEETVTATESALRAAQEGDARLVVVGGAAALRTPTGELVLDDANYLPRPYRPVGLASMAQLRTCFANRGADWVYLCPPAELLTGMRTGRFRRGREALLVDKGGRSRISMADLAAALMEEVEGPTVRRSYFTVAY